jgi:signal peptidase I
MAAVAHYTSTRTEERQGPPRGCIADRPHPGLGHIYRQARRGVTLFFLVIIADTLVFALMGVLARFWMFAISLGRGAGLWLYIIDASTRAYRMSEHPRRSYNTWQVMPEHSCWRGHYRRSLLTQLAKSSGQLDTSAPPPPAWRRRSKTGEYFLADATFYRGRQPSRGEVAVYVHPKQPDLHYIKRIIAVEGDRIAIKGGRAVVNGVAIEEPYVNVGAPDAAFANIVEIRVPPAHVFVLGDNRANSVDSRDSVAHGPVPVTKLIGRVTDIAFSHALNRMGRWIGTPGHL